MLLCTKDHLNRTVGNSTASILARFKGDQLEKFSAVSGAEAINRTSAGGAAWPDHSWHAVARGRRRGQAAGNVPATRVSHYVQQTNTLVPLNDGQLPAVRRTRDGQANAGSDAPSYDRVVRTDWLTLLARAAWRPRRLRGRRL